MSSQYPQRVFPIDMDAHNGLLGRVRAKVETEKKRRREIESEKEEEKVRTDDSSTPDIADTTPKEQSGEISEDQEDLIIESGDDTTENASGIPPSYTQKKNQNPEDWSDDELQRKIDTLHLERQELYALFRKSVAEGAQSVGVITLEDEEVMEEVEKEEGGTIMIESSFPLRHPPREMETPETTGMDREEGEVPP
ncbi:hypothetical protein BJ684DRAFT_20776 [Piptocephalis cylindrospora]|uniref:Uncharacterized protein n=1 Tax=Piptocephalis cylindrospora TaxID=1907219 RepID=A0A4P9Y3K0_9FUNG|nr:hypothetical protein BJ684DRAFT_20776 [Piptocephalis cylindrospora]|eukprot:RKP12701.1 hypothetical protein BJ684DRAFT_20776 [Piptocephalis cylindrospora]